jgi:hypothetical protein
MYETHLFVIRSAVLPALLHLGPFHFNTCYSTGYLASKAVEGCILNTILLSTD